jgi:hypothetical protein
MALRTLLAGLLAIACAGEAAGATRTLTLMSEHVEGQWRYCTYTGDYVVTKPRFGKRPWCERVIQVTW